MKNLSLGHKVAMLASVAIATVLTGVNSAQAESVLAPLAKADTTRTSAIAPSDTATLVSSQGNSEELLALSTDTAETGTANLDTANLDTANLDLFNEPTIEADSHAVDSQAAIEQPEATLAQSNSTPESSPESIVAQSMSTPQIAEDAIVPPVTEPVTDFTTIESDRRDATEATSESADDLLQSQATVESESQESVAETDERDRNNRNNSIAQAVDPGRATRSGPSYIGVGGNIGLGGSTTLGEGSFAVISKIGLTDRFSARPGIVIGGDDPVVLLPLTIDFPISSVAEAGEINVDAAPYIGGGIAISTGGDSTTRALVTAGVDIPVADRVTANAGVNFAFFDETEIGIVVGVGYNF